ncbi:hypothetical protein EZV62_007884 [Acer yangbiense]|uniref:Ubiquitin-like protease family profile domain-containing protein n=1 Tax=Acer yangbiense TaxID=1000413 RepID=A0A5C7ICL2_9ROSI|nr:hypothetical protein EZV62_007884 [Acer yangbiense]
MVINEDAMLPISNEVEGLLYLKDAIGYHILWPKELIVDDSINVVFEKHESKYAKGIQDFEGLSLIEMKVVGGNHLLLCIRNDKRACYIVERLQGSGQNQILLMPYNPGFHWVLVAIDKATLTVYYLDSLINEVETSLNIIIPLAIQKYQANLGSQSARVMQWEVVNFNGKERYTQEEIDEVRLEWIEHIKPFFK